MINKYNYMIMSITQKVIMCSVITNFWHILFDWQDVKMLSLSDCHRHAGLYSISGNYAL